MDGHFVPNITFGPMIVRAIRSITKLPLDTHLMVEEPDRYLEDFRRAGADHLTVHVEACIHLHRTICEIRNLGMKAGVSLNPATPALALGEIIPFVDQVLVMTVNPGFGGQRFIRPMLRKIREISEMISAAGTRADIEVDGGVEERNAAALVGAGATVLIAGYSIFAKKSIPRAVKSLRAAAHHSRPK
jgi:ribulose-phosphate 3-epimerase